MKKIYSLITAVLITSVSFAQAPTQGGLSFPGPKLTKERAYDKNSLRAVKQKQANNAAKTSAVGNGGWFNFGIDAEALYGATSTVSSNYLFPDSMGYGDFGGTFAPTWIHHIAEMVDFRSVIFSANASTNWVAAAPTAPIQIDSMSIFYAYSRNHPNPNIVDTLVVTVFDGPLTGTGVFTGSGFLNTAGNYPGGADTLSFKRLGYRQSQNIIAMSSPTTSLPPNQYKFKILLTIADTANVSYRDKSFKLPTSFSTVANKLTVADVQFKPGYTYTLTQQIDATANTFFFTSLEENGDASGAGTFMNYLDCGFGSALCDYSMSHVVPIDVRYNQAGTWNGRYIPTLAYTAPYGYEHHLISFYVTDNLTVGVKEASQSGVALGQNVPNPFTKESIVKYNLAKDASSAVFTVTDVMGRIISSEKVGTTTGAHSVKLGAYAAGLYYYSLNVDGNVTTKKMIVE